MRKKTRTLFRHFSRIPLALLIFIGSLGPEFAAAASDAPDADARQIEAMAQAELEVIAATLADSTSPDRLLATRVLVSGMWRTPVLREDLWRLLNDASSDPDPEVAHLASLALYLYQTRAELRAAGQLKAEPDEKVWERIARRQFERLAPIVADPGSPERHLAAQVLVSGSWGYRTLPDEVRELFERLRWDEDFEIARLAETVVARRDRRPIDRAFRLKEPRPGGSLSEAVLEEFENPDPTMRYDTLARLLDIAVNDGEERNPRLVEAFQRALSDPDLRVRRYAESALSSQLLKE